ncbi:hypothetical protein D1007_26590 [Hordeum vulgare]|nr:hypothetical protein D1007_26590 [Hordeum vulgare]
MGLVPFVDTDSEEEEENDDMFIEDEYDGEDMPHIERNKDNPNLNAGAVYKNMDELWNALTMYSIQSNNVCGTEKNEKRKLTVHCPDPRCSWKLHGTGMHGKKTIQDLPSCNHFEWMDEYIERLQMEGSIDLTGAAKVVLNLRSA